MRARPVRPAAVGSVLFGVACACGGAPRRLFVPDPRSTVLAVGAGAADLHFVDVDGDGHLDLVTRHLLQKRIAVARGDGRGGFAAAASAIEMEQLGAMELGDVDGDGAPDVVVATRVGEDEVIDVHLGQRDGTFRRTATSPVTVHARAETWKPSVMLRDVDEDGALDVITANGRRAAVAVLRGDGHGGFGPPRSIALPGTPGRYYLAAGDVDGDGHVDLVASYASKPDPATPGSVITLRGDGRGDFTAAASTARVPGDPALEVLADIDGDTDLDVVLSHDDSSQLSLLLNDGRGGFTTAAYSPLDVAWPAWDVEVADADGDGVADLIVATVDTRIDDGPSRVVVLRGDGRGFTPAAGSPYTSGPGAFDVAVADVDGDGHVDFAASSFGGDAVTLVRGR